MLFRGIHRVGSITWVRFLIFTVATLLITGVILPFSSVEAASSSFAVTYWPTGTQSGMPSVVGVVSQSDTVITAGSLKINNGAALTNCTVHKTDYFCNLSGVQWNNSYSVSGWVQDDKGNTSTVSWSFKPSQSSQGSGAPPNLIIASTSAYWGSFSDYLQSRLSVSSTLLNSGSIDAYNVTITGSNTTSGVELGSNLPVTVGDIGAAGSAVATLHYIVPTGTASFRQIITATAEDGNGNTYTYGSTQSPGAGKKIGISVGDNLADLSDQDLDSALADIASLGVGWIRFDMAWSAAQPNGPASYNWARFDRIVAAANRHNLQLVPILTYTPAWARPATCSDSFKCGPADPAQFASYAAAASARYAPMGIHTWEIWNEPNISQFWKPAPDAAAYTNLLKKSYNSIKQVDPLATVVSAGLSDPAGSAGGNLDPRDFLIQMYKNGAKDYMDAVGYHPYSFPNIPSGPTWTGWSVMGDTNPSIRSIMVSYGDGNKQVWATEFGSPTNGPTWRGDELLQAVMMRDGVQQIANKPWVAGLFLYSYRDLGTDTSTIENFFGIVRFDGSKKPAYYELKKVLAGQ